MKKILFACAVLGIAFLVAGCPQKQGITVYADSYAGSYEGVFDGTYSGEWGAIVDETGLFRGEFSDGAGLGMILVAKGIVEPSGELRGVMTSGEWQSNFSAKINPSTKIVSGTWASSYGKGALTGVKVGGTSLTIKNQSGATITDITYEGKIYSKLQSGFSCKIEASKQMQGYIFFIKDGKKYRTKEVVTVEKGKTSEFTFTDNTLIELLK